MSELTFEQMLEESLKTIHTGEVVEGTVIDVKPEEIILNIGYKSDGILTRSEYTNEPGVKLTEAVKPGDTMEVKVLKVNDGEGQVLLTYKRLAADRGNKRIEEAFNNKEVLTAKVTQVDVYKRQCWSCAFHLLQSSHQPCPQSREPVSVFPPLHYR